MGQQYVPPLVLTVLGAIFLLLGATCAIVIALDIALQKRWKTMMAVMIPTYVITALYFGPFAVWLYWRYGFMKHQKERDEPGQADNHTHSNTHQHHEMNEHRNMHGHHHHDSQAEDHAMKISDAPNQSQHHDIHHHHETAAIDHQDTKLNRDPHIRHQKPTPFYVSVLVGVTHCGAGCVLGDIVGEWLVYGTNVSINGRTLWPEMLIDYAFALLFGILFQYFSIAPMSGNWGVTSLIRAAKADIASLTAFEIGLFGWMAIYQIVIWDWRLGVVTTVYWWMMQVGMILGFLTAFPMNWVLIKWGIKEPHVM